MLRSSLLAVALLFVVSTATAEAQIVVGGFGYGYPSYGYSSYRSYYGNPYYGNAYAGEWGYRGYYPSYGYPSKPTRDAFPNRPSIA